MKLAEKRRDNVIAGIGRGKKPSSLLRRRLDTLGGLLWYNRCMLEGKCPKCGTRYFGWALRLPRHQMCPKCGVGLEITENGHLVSKGYSPFTAEKHLVNPPPNIPSLEEKDSRVQNE
ncbi:hypothetical protein ES703_95488 [subsurface metagenome]